MPSPRRSIVVIAAATLLAGAPATALTAVTQVIDGVPQVIAPQQLIVKCNPGALPILCSNALASVGAAILDEGQDVFTLLALPGGVSLQGALDTLRASSAIAVAEPNRVLLGSATYPQTWHFPAIAAPGDSSLLPALASPIVAVLDTGVAYENYQDAFGTYAQAPALAGTQFAQGWDFVNCDA